MLRVVHRAQQRFVEWLAGFQTFFIGLILLNDADTFSNSANLQFFRSIASEDAWGLFLLLVGAIRVIGLIINGARQEITPWIRAIGAFIGFMVFFGLSFGLFVGWWFQGNPPAMSLGMFGPAAFAELAAIIYSLRDAKAYRDGYGVT